MADKKRSGKPLWLEITGTLLTPIVIAMASYYVTYKINEQQQENAKRIADAQIQNSKIPTCISQISPVPI
ncbi:MAG: hypothetical protein K9J81_02890 [Desulfohalobiaceae bacterium]|nr:hypothetical protein [Desulfohalobiaceae bacterium]